MEDIYSCIPCADCGITFDVDHFIPDEDLILPTKSVCLSCAEKFLSDEPPVKYSELWINWKLTFISFHEGPQAALDAHGGLIQERRNHLEKLFENLQLAVDETNEVISKSDDPAAMMKTVARELGLKSSENGEYDE